jgi:hypothetical protein
MDGVSNPTSTDEQEKALRRSQAAAEAIARGQIKVPLRCGHCRAPSVVPDWELEAEKDPRRHLRCLQCSRRTPLEDAHTARKQEIRMIIAAGVDPRPHARGA